MKMNISDPVTDLKGIGSKTGELFHRVGVDTVGGLLSYYPRTYDVYESPVTLPNLQPGSAKKQAVAGVVKKAPSIYSGGRMKISTLQLEDFGDRLRLVWFNMPYIRRRLIPGNTYIFRGFVKKQRGSLVMEQPEVFEPETYAALPSAMQPVYPLTAGLSNKTVAKAARQALEGTGTLAEFLPEAVKERQGLISYDRAVRTIHLPESKAALDEASRRLKFDEFFLYAISIREMRRNRVSMENGFPFGKWDFAERLLSSQGYTLTAAQRRSMDEIKGDLQGALPMQRLLQGDVGSGKTVIAAAALAAAAENGYQGALMAPTEVLAGQHFKEINRMIKRAGLSVKTVLLTGSLDAGERREAYDAVSDGTAQIVIGTHALIQEKLHFKNLALVVTDEQHRFGVRQRGSLAGKGDRPHVLSMSATPIPRTLAGAVYGDMDISVIDEMPVGRLPIKNCVAGEEARPAAWRFIEKEVRAGHQAYVVCPMVEENPDFSTANVTDYTKELKKAYGTEFSIDCLHGKMKSGDKERIMADFACGKTKVLVSTTVIEVGINVKNATVMLVEDADRFGLTQLHQLRGRVGRGEAQGYCIFLSGTENEDTKTRLKVLEQSNDGFFIAAEDLKARGPGDLPGVRQSGLPAFRLGDIFNDQEIFTAAGEEAALIVAEDPDFQKEENLNLGKIVLFNSQERWYYSV